MSCIDRSRQNLRQLAQLLRLGPQAASSIYSSTEDPTQIQVGLSRAYSRRPPILFLGTGVSLFLTHGVEPEELIPAGWRSDWSELVRQAVSLLAIKGAPGADVVEKLRCDNNCKQSPEFILGFAHALCGDALFEVLADLFWRDAEETERIVQRIRDQREDSWQRLCEVVSRSSGVVTTNYDPLLWTMVKDASQQWQEPIVIGISSFSPVNPLVWKENCLVHLHGGLAPLPDRREAAVQLLSECVCTAQQYAAAYLSPCIGAGSNSLAVNWLKTILSSDYPLAFIGFGFHDYLIQTLMAIADDSRDKKLRYALLPTVDVGGARSSNTDNGIFECEVPEQRESKRAIESRRIAASIPGEHILDFYEELLGVHLIPLECVMPQDLSEASGASTTYSIAEATDLALRKLLGIAHESESEERSRLIDSFFNQLGIATGGETSNPGATEESGIQEVD